MTPPQTVVTSTNPLPLRRGQLDTFAEQGYLVLPDFLPAGLVSRLRPEVDRWVDNGLRARSIASATDPRRHGPPPLLELELEAHGQLVVHPPLLALLRQLMGADFAYHHLHSDRLGPASAGKPWHHDYEQRPQRERTHRMIHALHYLNGIDTRTAALVVLPGSHREIAEKDARAHLDTAVLPGEVVVDQLPPGSTVVLHSALFHARRPRPVAGGGPRYLIDASYCQVGVQWPPVKPHWRDILRMGRKLGLDGGDWPELFAERHFSEYVPPA